MSRVGGILVPYIAEICITFSLFGPIIAIAFCSFLSFFLTLALPFETYGKPLDNDQFEVKNISQLK